MDKIEETQQLLTQANTDFVGILSEKIKKAEEGKTLQQVLVDFITVDNIAFITEDEKVTIVLPDNTKIELTQEISDKITENGIGDKVFTRTITRKHEKPIITKKEQEIINIAKEGKELNKRVFAAIIVRIQNRIDHLNDVIKTKQESKYLNPLEPDKINKEIEDLKQQIKELQYTIMILQKIIEEYERNEAARKAKEEEEENEDEHEKDPVIVPVFVPHETTNPTEEDKEKEEQKKQEEDAEKKRKRARIAALLLATALAIPLLFAKSCGKNGKQNPEPEPETKEEQTIPQPDPEEDPTIPEEEDEKDLEEIEKEIYEEYYQLITENMDPGEVSRELQDAYDGYNYDQGLMGRETTPYSYNQETNVEPSAEFIKKYQDFKEKYSNYNPDNLDQMIEEGNELLKEYEELIVKTIKEVHRHNESTQEVIDLGIRDTNDNKYATQKVITEQQEEDLKRKQEKAQEIMKILQESDPEKIISLLGKDNLSVEINGDIIIITDENNKTIYTTAKRLITDKELVNEIDKKTIDYGEEVPEIRSR